MKVTVVYALADQQTVLHIDVEKNCTALEAIKHSGILEKHPDIDLEKNKVGVYGKAVKHEHVLSEHDRVEIYRPLVIDPKTARKLRVKK